MARAAAKFRQTDIAAMLKGVIKAGWTREQIAGVRTTATGVEVLFGEPKPAQNGDANEWDQVLK